MIQINDAGSGGADPDGGSGLRAWSTASRQLVASSLSRARRVAAPRCALDPAGVSDGPAPIRIVLADDAILLREALADALAAGGFEVVGQAGDVPGLLDLVAQHRRMSRSSMSACRRLTPLRAWKRPRAFVASILQWRSSSFPSTSRRATRSSSYAPILLASGMLKDRISRVADLADAVRRVSEGGSVIDPEVVARLLGRPRTHTPLDELTPREREILGLMAEGRSNPGIAAGLSWIARPSRDT